MHAALRILTISLAAAALGACSASGTGEFRVPAGQSAAAFNASREVLRDYRFTLERLDAQAGIITTQAKPTAGLATPWDREQTSLGQELTDWANQQRRSVRITLDPPSGEAEGVGLVIVTVWRVQSPLVRPSSRAVALTTWATDPQASVRGVGGTYDVPSQRDERLEARLARAIERSMAGAAPGTSAAKADSTDAATK